jgi:hypothetical protein
VVEAGREIENPHQGVGGVGEEGAAREPARGGVDAAMLAKCAIQIIHHLVAARGGADLPADADDMGLRMGGLDALFAFELVAAVVVVGVGTCPSGVKGPVWEAA